ncbi:hypothetical protein ACJIZ3_016949 [Penstemon smallii]|uniref:Non-structural maintenance of chromosomes element 4 n=1 Tax=Penstemon smallii TaxID=265156 RepID=A0ABD3SUC3_9LAMI
MAAASENQQKSKRVRPRENGVDPVVSDNDEASEEDYALKRRNILSHYREIENRINEEKDEIANVTSDKFMAIMNQVDNMHQHVSKPREQVADAETLLGLATSLAACVKALTAGGVTPSEFVSSLIKQFGQRKSMKGLSKDSPNIKWLDIGLHVSTIFKNGPGCMTMIGPMKNELKLRKSTVRAKRSQPVGSSRPKEVEKAGEVVTDTDRNLRTMFEILIKHKNVKLENMILNRNSFAQTIENLFALSFLVKDGRVSIKVDENGSQLIAPCNGPSAQQIKSGEAKNHSFIFRFDFNDWKLMKNLVVEGEELMPHRDAGFVQAKAGPNDKGFSQVEVIPIDSKILNAAPVKKFSRNCGRVVNYSGLNEIDDGTILNWNCKRKRSI